MGVKTVKGTLRGGRKGEGTAKHNDHGWMPEDTRNVDIMTFPYDMDIDLTPRPGQYISDGMVDLAIRECTLKKECDADELQFYNQCFGGTLARINDNYRKNREYKRMKTMEQWRESKNHCPSEYVLQVGNMDCCPDRDVLTKSLKELIDWERKTLGRNYAPISAAGHYDETTPHYHERGVFIYWDADGYPQPNVKKALEQAGIPLVDPAKKESRTNNRKAMYDSMKREKWLDILEKNLSADYRLDRTVDKSRKVGHMGVDAYKSYMAALDDVAHDSMMVDIDRQQVAARESELDEREYSLNRRESEEIERGIEFNQRMQEIETEQEYDLLMRRQSIDLEMTEREAELYAAESDLEARSAILERKAMENTKRAKELLKTQNTLSNRVSEFNAAVMAHNHLIESGKKWDRQVTARRQQGGAEHSRIMDAWRANHMPGDSFSL